VVKIAFIVEGDSEKILIDSDMFRKWCETNGITIVEPIINAKGGGNLLPQYLSNHVANVSRNGKPDKIVVLTDLEWECAVVEVQNRILTEEFKDNIDVVFVSVKALEAWFLADDEAMSSWLKERFHEDYPECTDNLPLERIKQIAKDRDKRGPGPKPGFAKKMTSRHGFSLERAAEHPNCPSVKNFRDTLKEWGGG